MPAVEKSVPLSALEKSTLKNAEDTIRKHINAFVDVGNALAAIRDQQLYRVEYKTFETYCKAKWDFTARRAYQLIDAAGVVQNVNNCSQTPTNEGQARILAELPPEQQAEAWTAAVEKAEETGKPVTAAMIEEVVAELVEPEDEIVPVTPPKPEPVKDAKGKKIPADLLDSWRETEQLDAWSRELNAVLRNVKAFAATKEGAWLDLLTFGRDIANCKHALKFAKPYVVCHDCGGDGCQTCRKTGWLPQTSLTRNAPAEEKSA